MCSDLFKVSINICCLGVIPKHCFSLKSALAWIINYIVIPVIAEEMWK